ncbi:hypothetical protein GEV33_004264 [Tenebrio molitor]|jgi:hypothetical protein|uniref:Uncharacterized protein n=1 Tax=Tenebrio molitor TaxID=7067 RepID=A0A8J6LG46_TENMO|nr:hypothetical protein GEV33_004264 [Tenebrio molitor]
MPSIKSHFPASETFFLFFSSSPHDPAQSIRRKLNVFRSNAPQILPDRNRSHSIGLMFLILFHPCNGWVQPPHRSGPSVSAPPPDKIYWGAVTSNVHGTSEAVQSESARAANNKSRGGLIVETEDGGGCSEGRYVWHDFNVELRRFTNIRN